MENSNIESTADVQKAQPRKRTRGMRNLIKRGRVWYFKKLVHGRLKFVSLETEDVELARAKRDKMLKLADNNELDRIQGARSKSATLAEVFEKYTELASITSKAVEGNKCALLTVCRFGLGREAVKEEELSLDLLTRKLVRDYQDAVRRAYEARAGSNEKARRTERDRADRTSKSTFGQARSIFSGSMIERFEEAGLSIPECVREFCGVKAEGKMTSKVYFPASDEVLTQTFQAIEALKISDPQVYRLFWVSLGTGCRRGEAVDLTVAHLVELQGHLWVSAGIGKDGRPIQIPVVNWPVHAASVTIPSVLLREWVAERKAAGKVELFEGLVWQRHDELPKRLNAWLLAQGWSDEKKMHALRAYIGCTLFRTNPRLAQRYMRHKSLVTTEQYYSHFLALTEVIDFMPQSVSTGPLAAVVVKTN